MKKKFVLLALTIIIILLFPISLFAVGSPMGTNCDGNDDCASGDCEDSDIVAANDDFCVCGEPTDCEQAYSKEQGETWKCTDEDDDEMYGLHYCESDTRGKQSPFTVGQLAGQKAQAEKAEGEKQTPYQLQPPKINVQFDTLQPFTTTMVNPGEAVSIPWMAEYIIAVYRYAIIIGSILAVIVIMIGGVLYLTAGGIPGNVKTAGSLIFGAITGLVLLLSSYLILNTINPNLTKLSTLTITTLTEESLDPSDLDYVASSPTGDYLPDTKSATGEFFPCANKTADCGGAVAGLTNLTEAEKIMVKVPFPATNGVRVNKIVASLVQQIGTELSAHGGYDFCKEYVENGKKYKNCPFGFNWRPLKTPRIKSAGLYKDYFEKCQGGKGHEKAKQEMGAAELDTFCKTYHIAQGDVSMHGYGLAVDLNPWGNPNCKLPANKKKCDAAGGQVTDIPAWVVDIFQKYHFKWLKHDPMHFEWDGNL